MHTLEPKSASLLAFVAPGMPRIAYAIAVRIGASALPKAGILALFDGGNREAPSEVEKLHWDFMARGSVVVSFASIDEIKERYGVIYADPAWKFSCWSTNGLGRSAQVHYRCMEFGDLAKLPVAGVAAQDCVLFLWVTDPMLPMGFDLLRAWGFEYKTVAFYWAKLNKKAQSDASYFMGGGYWTRANPEQCWLAVRGKPERLSRSIRRLVVDRVREHSRKPDVVRDRIEELVAGPYLELFARETKPGWDCWGNQAGLFDRGSVQTRRWASGGSHKQAPELAGFDIGRQAPKSLSE